MVKELELAAADSVGALAKPKRKPRPAHTHTHCLNCGAQLHGRYCAQCGQSADDHHRSILHLVWEFVEDLTHLDGRLALTVPALFFRPGKLARDHIEGRRTRHVPPFRLFLISLLLFMLSLETMVHRAHVQTVSPSALKPAAAGAPANPSPPATRTISFPDGAVQIGPGSAPKAQNDPYAGIDALEHSSKHHSPFGRWLIDHARKAKANGEYYRTVAFEWGHRLAILLLPIFALLLTGLYFYKRQFYVYDHLLVSMQFLSFVFLLWAGVYVAPHLIRQPLFFIATLWVPVNLFMTLRGAYGSSIVGAGLKTVFLWVSTMVVFLLLLLAILAVALNQL